MRQRLVTQVLAAYSIKREWGEKSVMPELGAQIC